jgi:hypothetical protein
VFDVTRRSNNGGPSRSAMAGLELIIAPAGILTIVQPEPVSRRPGQPATITARKASGLAVRCHDVVRIASRDRAGLLCPYIVGSGMGARWGRRVSLVGGRRLFEQQFSGRGADNSRREVKRSSVRLQEIRAVSIR